MFYNKHIIMERKTGLPCVDILCWINVFCQNINLNNKKSHSNFSAISIARIINFFELIQTTWWKLAYCGLLKPHGHPWENSIKDLTQKVTLQATVSHVIHVKV